MTYTNYQLPASAYPQPASAPASSYSNYYADPFAPSPSNTSYDFGFPSTSRPQETSTSTDLVPSYGPPPSTTAVPANDDVDPALAAIIASQERALAAAKQRNQGQHHNGNSSSSRGTSRAPTMDTSNYDADALRNSHTLSDAVIPTKHQMKAGRQTKTAAGAAGGAVLGGIMFGPAFPVGMVLGGAVGGYATNKISKSGERRAQRKFEQDNVRRQAQRSAVVGGAFA